MSATPVQIAEVSVLPPIISYIQANIANPLNLVGNTTILLGQLSNLGIPLGEAELAALGNSAITGLQAKLDAAKAAVAAG